MLRIAWTEHVTNEWAFNRANIKPTLLDGFLKRRLAFHGHLARKGVITFDLMIGRIHGDEDQEPPGSSISLIKLPPTTKRQWLYREVGASGGVSATREGRQMSEGENEN